MMKKAALILVLALSIGALAAAIGCGLKGKLVPRDKPMPDDEQIPRGWIRPAPTPVVPPYDEGTPLPPGDPGRLRSRDLTPPPAPHATPTPAPTDSSPAPGENP